MACRSKIKMMVSTMDSQGARPNDFCFAPEGEPVWFPFVQSENIQCGCNHSMVGFFSRNKTTTFKIESIDADSVCAAVAAMATKIFGPEHDEFCNKYANSIMKELQQIGARFSDGDILELQQNVIVKRQIN